jgi:hypothetical protein
MRRLARVSVPVLFVLGLLMALPGHAGTQDFTLVNQTGSTIYSLFVSESDNDSWEEDVLGEDVLPNGRRMNVTFSGRRACLWDLRVTDPDDNEVTWTEINLCQVSVVVLRCKRSECWAEFE